MMGRRRAALPLASVLVVSGVVAAAPPATAAPVAAAPAVAPVGIVVKDGLTQPVFSLADAVQERVWVGTRLDTDHDGKLDRIAIDIARPRETETAGLKVPVIFEHSPYRKDTWNDVPYPSVLVPDLPQNGLGHGAARAAGPAGRAVTKAANLPGSLDDYYVPRGYAVVLGQSIGTADSDGCPTSGDQAETLGTKAVIDWLAGRAPGYDAAGNRVTAGWTTGEVGMTGVSYNGTLPNMVATTGVPNLKTIIPVSAISDWYRYYRSNGLVVAPGTFQGEDLDILAEYTAGQARAEGRCADEIAHITAEQDRVTGDKTRFWRDRDYLPAAGRVRASVFVVHGINDWNVKTDNFAAWWDRLAGYGVPRKIWLHQGGHGGPGSAATVTLPSGQAWTYKQTENRWFDYWLWHVDNGIMGEPRAVIQREDRVYTTYRDWPDPGARPVKLRLNGTALAPSAPLRQQPQSFVDAGRDIPPADLVAGPEVASPNRLVYQTAPLSRDARLSGRPSVHLRLSIDNKPDANLTAYLVDYSSGEPFVITRGWLDPQNRFGAGVTVPLRQGRAYDLRFTMEPKDYVVPAGHRLGLVIFSSDQEYTLLPPPGTQLTVTPGRSDLTLPLVGALS